MWCLKCDFIWILTRVWLDADDDEDEDDAKEVALVAPCEKARALIYSSDAVDNNKCSLPTLIAAHAHPDAQKQKVEVLVLLASGTQHARFEASNEEASASMLKVFHELPEH